MMIIIGGLLFPVIALNDVYCMNTSFHEGYTSVSISQHLQHRHSDGFHSNNYMP